MKDHINLGIAESGEHVTIDLPTLVSTRLLVTASSGGGKSETLRRILEEAVGRIQCIVIDPEGEFATLREKKPFVLVGEGGETPADIRTAALVATRLLELNASAVCDIYEMKIQERHEWVRRFLDAMVQAPKSLWHPVLVIVDESHTYAPEKGYGESVALQPMIDLANLGRKRGFCLIPATQRLSKLSKNVTEPMQNILVGRTMFDDQERAARIFKIKPGAETREFSLELERLKDGQFIARGRAFNGDMLKVQVTRAETRPPKTGSAMAAAVSPAPAEIRALLPKLADLPHEAQRKVETEDSLRDQLRHAERRVAEMQRDLEIAAQGNVSKERERMLVEQIQNMERELESYRTRFAAITEVAETAERLAQQLRALQSGLPAAVEVPAALKAPLPAPLSVLTVPALARTPQREERVDGLDGPSSRVLRALADLAAIRIDPAPREQVAVFAGYSNLNSKGLVNAMGALRSAGLIDYPEAGKVQLTSEGRKAAPRVERPATENAYHERLFQMMGGPESRILQVLIERRGRAIERPELAAKAGYTNLNSKGFVNSMGRLRTLGLLDYPSTGMVCGTALLFLR